MILNRLYELAVREKLLAEAAFEEQPVPYVIVVDDGSDDGTTEAARGQSASNRLTVITHPNRSGKSAALRTGAIAAQTIWVGTMDGDGQDDPADLVRMAQEVDLSTVGAIGLVGGVRQNRTDGSSRKTASRLANGLRRTRGASARRGSSGRRRRRFRRTAQVGFGRNGAASDRDL